MSTEEYVIFLDEAVKRLTHSVNLLNLADDKNVDSIGKLIQTAKWIKEDLDNVFVRLDRLEAKND